MTDFPKKLTQKLQKRVSENALRKLPIPNSLIDFSSNDYLGFSNELWIKKRVKEILNQLNSKNGATGSRLLSGNHPTYQNLEEQLARIYSCEAALVFNSGYDANLGLFASVPQRGDFIFYDEYAHASIREGIRLSNAKSYKFQHNNLIDLKAKIERAIKADSKIAPYEIYVVTESVFSMDGDAPDLRTLAAFCATNTYHLIVDEAHAIGVYGEGLCVAEAIQRDVFARIVTFGKALGSHGAAILGTYLLKEYLINFAKSFIYTTALPPHSIATSIAAHELLVSKTGSISQTKLLENINYFKQELEKNGLKSNFIESNSAIQCMKVNGNQNVKNSSVKLVEKGFDVKPILSPTVPKGKERLRFCLHAYNTKKEIKSLVQILKNI